MVTSPVPHSHIGVNHLNTHHTYLKHLSCTVCFLITGSTTPQRKIGSMVFKTVCCLQDGSQMHLGCSWSPWQILPGSAKQTAAAYSRQSQTWTMPLPSSISCLECSSFSTLSLNTLLSCFLSASICPPSHLSLSIPYHLLVSLSTWCQVLCSLPD